MRASPYLVTRSMLSIEGCSSIIVPNYVEVPTAPPTGHPVAEPTDTQYKIYDRLNLDNSRATVFLLDGGVNDIRIHISYQSG